MRGGSVPACYTFPEDGRERSFQAFKKAGLAEKVPIFNESYSNFYKRLTPDFERTVSILSEHQKRWMVLVKKCEAVDLIQML
jgi:hypothetical protein